LATPIYSGIIWQGKLELELRIDIGHRRLREV